MRSFLRMDIYRSLARHTANAARDKRWHRREGEPLRESPTPRTLDDVQRLRGYQGTVGRSDRHVVLLAALPTCEESQAEDRLLEKQAGDSTTTTTLRVMAMHPQVRGCMERSSCTLLRWVTDGLGFHAYVRWAPSRNEGHSRQLDTLGTNVGSRTCLENARFPTVAQHSKDLWATVGRSASHDRGRTVASNRNRERARFTTVGSYDREHAQAGCC